MNELIVFFSWMSVCAYCPAPTQHTNRTVEQIPVPANYKRINVSSGSFGWYLRKQELKKEKTVYLYNGKEKYNQQAQYAVLNISVGNKDLQQCADAIMRIRAEFLKATNLPICFSDNANKKYCWSNYQHKGWQRYLETVFGMCGTLSLEKELKPTSWKNLKPGDVLIKGGSPGHAVLVMDVARHPGTGEQLFLLAQSYMPAQDVHILQNLSEKSISPWFREPLQNTIFTPEWTFYANQLRSWPSF